MKYYIIEGDLKIVRSVHASGVSAIAEFLRHCVLQDFHGFLSVGHSCGDEKLDEQVSHHYKSRLAFHEGADFSMLVAFLIEGLSGGL